MNTDADAGTVPAPATGEVSPGLLPSAPDRPVTAPNQRPPAVLALLEREAAARRAGNPTQAAAELERALRIAPRDRELWLRLAQVRLQQRQWQQAESTALKCVSMGGGDAALTRSAWEVVATARAARGDAPGAEAARRRAASLPVP